MGGECQAWHMGANFRDSGRRVQVQVLGCSEGAARWGAGNDAARSRRGSFKSPCAGEVEEGKVEELIFFSARRSASGFVLAT